jgi:uncharacterized protein YjbI with pentapeptide repeats
MTSTFLGKWRFSFQWAVEYNNYIIYGPERRSSLSDLYTYTGPAIKATNFAFIRGSDSKLYFQMNNGKYVQCSFYSFRFADTLAEAANFSFPGHEQFDPPTSFHSRIEVVGTDRFMVHVQGSVIAGYKPKTDDKYTISQITPSLATVQATGKGDGFDFGWVDFTGATLNKVSLVGSDFSNCNLTNFKFLNCVMRNAILDNCTPTGADFSGSVLAGAKLNRVDLTGVLANAPLPEFYLKPLQPPSTDNPRTTFNGSCLKHSLLGNDWSMLDLSGTTIIDLATPLSSQAKPLQVKYSIVTGLNQNNLSDLNLQYAAFDHAILDNVNLNGADLSNASFIQASMHNTVLSNATLKNAQLSGAQLGSLGQLFNLPAGYESHLKAGPQVNDALRDQFKQHGITLSANATLNTLAADRAWQVNDAGHRIMYTVRLDASDSSQVLTVYKAGIPASLVNAYMPNAVLTGANLFGVTANNIQFYGSNARIDGSAILEEAKLNNSNLSTVNFTQAQLMGANLSHCHLFNAKFNKANLTPSGAGTVTDLSHSNLQGADFTDARLYGANLTNAAVAINVPTTRIAKQGGVYLFSLPYKDDNASLEQYKTELTTAAKTLFSLNPGGDSIALQKYLTALKTNDLNTLRVAFLRHNINLSTDAKIQVAEVDLVWLIVDGAQTYTLWTDTDEQGKLELNAASSLTKMRAAFKRNSMTLRLQASATTDKPDQQWLLDNDSENPQNFSTGYVKFIVTLNSSVLDIYGTALRILRMGDNNQEEFATETCQITTISNTNMNADTVCPNGSNLKVNQSRSGKEWDPLWLRAVTPPRPPNCVPTNNNWCPQSKIKM